MAHTYTSLTKSDNAYTPVSDVTPDGTGEEKLTWNAINGAYDTWKEFDDYGKIHWCDWWYGTPFTDAWELLTTPSATYSEVTV